MKLIKILLLTLMIMMLSACGSGEDDIVMNPLDPVERDENEEGQEGYSQVEVVDNGAEESVDAQVKDEESTEEVLEEDGQGTTEDGDSEDIASEDGTSEDGDSGENDELEEVVEEILMEEDDYQVLDLSEVEDENSYETGLVFILQEGDIWRVVDRLGNVYRVSTSNESVAQGIVNLNASVTTDNDGNAKVSLSRDYDKYSNIYTVNVESSIENEFSEALLKDQQKAATSSKIDSYTINSVSSETLGKGIRVITMNFDVVPSDGASSWGTNPEAYKNVNYTYTIYGYETTWLLPEKPPLFANVVTASGNSEVVNDTEDSNSSDGAFSANDLQRILAEVNGKVYYSEKERLPQSASLTGTDIYEHNIKIYEYNASTGNISQIVKGNKNGNYNLLKVYEGKLFLMVSEETPSAGGSLIGLSYINLKDLSYRSLYNGQVAKGITVGDKAYVFTNDNLVEIDLVNASIRIASNLPEHLEFDVNSIKVNGFEDKLLTVEISYETEAITYTIDVISGETIVIDSFSF